MSDVILGTVYKHLQGKHDQKTHGRRGGVSYQSEIQSKENESDFYSAKNERAYIYTKKGELLYEQQGGHNVKFSKEQILSMDNAILTHNHPYPYPPQFSPDDVAMAVRANLSEIRATSDAGTYILRRPKGKFGWNMMSGSVYSYFERTRGDWEKITPVSKYDNAKMLDYIWSNFSEDSKADYTFIARK